MVPIRMKQVITALLGAGAILTAVFTTVTITTGNITTVNSTTVSATTVGATTVSSTALVIGSGTSIDKHLRATTTVDPNSLGAGQATTSAVTLTGAVAGDHCSVNVTSGDLGGTTSTAVLRCQAATDSATITYYNTTGTAYNAGTSTLSVQIWSY